MKPVPFAGCSRRSALKLLGSGVALPLLSACGAALPKLSRPSHQPRVALWNASADPDSSGISAFVDALARLGYTAGVNLAFDWHLRETKDLPPDEVAQQIVASAPDAIVVAGTPTLVALAQATQTIPIVACLPHRSLQSLGVAWSPAHPGGNVTGTEGKDEYYAKMVELLKATIPTLSRVAYLRNPTTPGTEGPMALSQDAAAQLGIQFIELHARNFDEIEQAFAAAVDQSAQGMVVATDAAYTSGGEHYPATDPLMALPLRYHMPAIYSNGDAFVASGGLMGFGVDLRDSYVRAATFVDKILRGASPADLPIEQSMAFDVSVNLTTARALGITFPPEVMALANLVYP